MSILKSSYNYPNYITNYITPFGCTFFKNFIPNNFLKDADKQSYQCSNPQWEQQPKNCHYDDAEQDVQQVIFADIRKYLIKHILQKVNDKEL